MSAHHIRSLPAQEDPVAPRQLVSFTFLVGARKSNTVAGLFLELGPCLFVKDGLEHNPHSWNTNTNLFFLDQPVGVGYSYADHGEKVVRLVCSSLFKVYPLN